MPAIPPSLPTSAEMTYQVGDYQLESWVSDQLGDALTAADGFDAIFDDAANSFPGVDIVQTGLDPLLADFQDALTPLGVAADPGFEGDLAVQTDIGLKLVGGLADVGINIPTPTLSDFPSLADIAPGALAPGFLQTDTMTAEREVGSTFVKITNDGNVSWYIQSTEPEPVQVLAADDGADWVLWAEGRQGNANPDFIGPGHFTAFEWRNPRGILAQAYIDQRGAVPQTQVNLFASAPASPVTFATVTAGLQTTVSAAAVLPPTDGIVTFATGLGPTNPAAPPAGALPQGSITIDPAGYVSWTTANVKSARLDLASDLASPLTLAVVNSYSRFPVIFMPGHNYVFTLYDMSVLGAPVKLDQQTFAAPSAPPQMPSVVGVVSNPQANPVGTADQLAAAATNPVLQAQLSAATAAQNQGIAEEVTAALKSGGVGAAEYILGRPLTVAELASGQVDVSTRDPTGQALRSAQINPNPVSPPIGVSVLLDTHGIPLPPEQQPSQAAATYAQAFLAAGSTIIAVPAP